MITEEKAKTKWCPKARPSENIGDYERGDKWIAGANRDAIGGVISGARCIASECMAWRWHQIASHAYVAGFLPETTWETSSTHGHCGLAGAP